jgi:hypothetical protein
MGGKAKIIRPAKRLKPFFWNKVTNTVVTTTVWNDVSSDFHFNMDDLEATFTIDNNPSTPSQIRSPTRKQNITTLLDITRANNVGKSAQHFILI